MIDRNVQWPARYQLQKVPGTDDIYDIIPAPGTVYDEGTLINKATLLKDTTAAEYGLGTDAVPDDVFKKIAGNIFAVGDTLTTMRTDLGDEWMQCSGAVLGRSDYEQLSDAVPVSPFGDWADQETQAKSTYNFGGGTGRTSCIHLNGYYYMAAINEQKNDGISVDWLRASTPAGPWTTLWTYTKTLSGIYAVYLMYGSSRAVILIREASGSGSDSSTLVTALSSTSLDAPLSSWTSTTVYSGNSFSVVDAKFLNGNFVIYGLENSSGAQLSYPVLYYGTGTAWTKNAMSFSQASSNGGIAYVGGNYVLIYTASDSPKSLKYSKSPDLGTLGASTAALYTYTGDSLGGVFAVEGFGNRLIVILMADEIQGTPYNLFYFYSDDIDTLPSSFAQFYRDNVYKENIFEIDFKTQSIQKIGDYYFYIPSIRFANYDAAAADMANHFYVYCFRDDLSVVPIKIHYSTPDVSALNAWADIGAPNIFSVDDEYIISFTLYGGATTGLNNYFGEAKLDLTKIYIPTVPVSDGLYTYIKVKEDS